MYLDAVNKYDEQSRQTLFAIIPYAQEIENLRLELQGWRDTKTLKTPMCTCWSNPETGMLELGPVGYEKAEKSAKKRGNHV
jgi:hypothetical protein